MSSRGCPLRRTFAERKSRPSGSSAMAAAWMYSSRNSTSWWVCWHSVLDATLLVEDEPGALSLRALADIDAINRYSVERWRQRVADRYLADISSALDRLEQDLSLFKSRHDYTGRLRFYRVREHVLIGDVIGGTGYVLAVWRGQMDFIERLPRPLDSGFGLRHPWRHGTEE